MWLLSFVGHTLAKRVHTCTKYGSNSLRLYPTRRSCSVWRGKIHTSALRGPWRVLFFGSDDFALESLKHLHKEYRSNVLSRLEVVTSHTGKENVVTKYARENEIVLHDWPVRDDISNFHIGIVVSFGHLIPSSVINLFPLGMINVHGSLLPRWRGAAPIIHALMNGDVETGVTIMKIKPKKFDIGEIVAQRQTPIHPYETMPELRARLARIGGDLLIEIVNQLPEILSRALPQSTVNITYAPKVTSEISAIDWSTMTAKNIYDLHRALSGLYPPTAKFLDMTVKLSAIRHIERPNIASRFMDDEPGTAFYDKNSDSLFIKCKEDSWIAVKKIATPGQSAKTARDFSNGFISGRKHKKITFK